MRAGAPFREVCRVAALPHDDCPLGADAGLTTMRVSIVNRRQTRPENNREQQRTTEHPAGLIDDINQ